jgi:hypothetical protein
MPNVIRLSVMLSAVRLSVLFRVLLYWVPLADCQYECYCSEYHYAMCRYAKIMLSVSILSFAWLNVILQNVAILILAFYMF